MRISRHFVSLRTYALAFAVALSPAVLQITTCDRGNTDLSSLEFEVGGQNLIQGFDTALRTYVVSIDDSAATATLRATSLMANSELSWQWRVGGVMVDSGPIGVGGGEVPLLDIPSEGLSQLRVVVRAGAPNTAVGYYTIKLTRWAITVACSDNLHGGPVEVPPLPPFPFDLHVEPGPIVAGNPFTAELTGVARVPELWVLTLFNGVVCGGVRTIGLFDLVATVSVRSGATGADVELGIDAAALSPGPTRLCNFPGEQICTTDTECIGGTCNPPILLQDIPVIDGIPLSPGGCEPDLSNCPNLAPPPPDCDCSACAALDPPGCGTPGLPSCFKSDQCERNGFCVAGDVPVQLERRTGSYTADPVSGTPILFGWFDGNPPPTNPDGTLQLPEASFANPVPPIGIRVDGGGLAVPLQCLMGVDSGGPYGIGIPDEASPTPDSLLITFVVP